MIRRSTTFVLYIGITIPVRRSIWAGDRDGTGGIGTGAAEEIKERIKRPYTYLDPVPRLTVPRC